MVQWTLRGREHIDPYYEQVNQFFKLDYCIRFQSWCPRAVFFFFWSYIVVKDSMRQINNAHFDEYFNMKKLRLHSGYWPDRWKLKKEKKKKLFEVQVQIVEEYKIMRRSVFLKQFFLTFDKNIVISVLKNP